MIHIDVEQGSPEWAMARIGIPTASQFHRILTPKTRKLSGQAVGYMHELLAEWALGCSLDGAQSSLMERGELLEGPAAEWYEFQRDVECKLCGLFLLDDRSAGASPDRLVGDDGLLEVKCPGGKNFVAYLLGSYNGDHFCQVQGQLYVTGRKWCDLLIYHPEMPSQIVRMERDEEFIGQLDAALRVFHSDMLARKAELRKMGIEPARVAALV
jgi:hypothetical protein